MHNKYNTLKYKGSLTLISGDSVRLKNYQNYYFTFWNMKTEIGNGKWGIIRVWIVVVWIIRVWEGKADKC